MMKKINFKKAYTMAELVIAMVIIAFLATITTGITRSKIERANKYYYYAAYTTLTSLAAEIIADSDDGLIPDSDICSEFESRLNVYPDEDIQSCDEDHSSIDDNTDFSELTPNIITRSGMKFYNLNPEFLFKLELLDDGDEDYTNDEKGYIIYIDIDGDRNSSTAYTDVFPFFLTLSGKVIPAYDTNSVEDALQNSTDVMVFSVRYETVTDSKLSMHWLVKSASFQEAACTAGYVSRDTDYCKYIEDYTEDYDSIYDCTADDADCILVPLKPIKFMAK